MNSNKKRGLGRGLEALLQNPETDITTKGNVSNNSVGSVANIDIELIEANPFQPRTEFEKYALEELSASIQEHGIIQPLTVRKMGGNRYQLISGERRFRASQMAGLESVPAYIRIANDQEMLEMALVENIQRENLNAIEVALSYKRLLDECKMTQEELSKKVSKNRTTVTNHLRLLKLPAEIQLGIRADEISMGHARALVSLEDSDAQIAIFEKIVNEKLSVREVENLVRNYTPGAEKKPVSTPKVVKLSETEEDFTEDLSDKLGVNVNLSKNNKGKGRLVINFNSNKELDRIIEELS